MLVEREREREAEQQWTPKAADVLDKKNGKYERKIQNEEQQLEPLLFVLDPDPYLS